MSQLFKKKVAGVDANDSISSMLTSLSHLSTGAPFISPLAAKAAISLEGIGNYSQDIETATENLRSHLQKAMSGVASLAKLTPAQEEAAISSSIYATNPSAFLSRTIASEGALKASATDTMIVMTGNSQGAEKRAISSEAFDTQANRNTALYSMIYNAQASRQNDFGEAFFPTVIVGAEEAGYTVNVRLVEVMSTVRRDVNGKLADFERKNVVGAEKDHTILKNDITKLVPVFRAGANGNAALFNADVGQRTIVVNGESVVTGAINVGVKYDLLGLSQTDAGISSGIQDETDSVDSSVSLSSVFVKLAGGDVVQFKTKNIPTSSFNAAVQGNARSLNLSFSTDSLQVSAQTKQVDGTPLNGAATIGTNSVRLSASLFGSINQQQGDTILSGETVSLVKVFDDAGNQVDTAVGPGADIAALFDGAKLIAYDLYAHRTNSNRRNRGQLVDTREMNYLYTVPVLPPVSAIRPVANSDQNDPFLLSALVTTTRVRTSNEAVTALFEAKDYLKEYVSSSNSGADAANVFGAARELVTPSYIEAVIDVSDATDSLKSSDRAEDVVAVLINKIRDVAFRLYQSSNYKAAADALAGGEAVKPTVIIGTDQILGRYLTFPGDMRLIGDNFNHKVVMSADQRMVGKIVISFGNEQSAASGTPNVLHFGNMAWKPELTIVMPTTRNGAIAQELSVQPMFRHVANLPVMGFLEVSGIEKIIASKVVLNTHPV